MKQLLNVFMGSLVVMGYFAFESTLWFVWNGTGIGLFTTLGYIVWIQAVGIVFAYKIIKFDSGKLNPQAPQAPIILTQDLLKKFANKKDGSTAHADSKNQKDQ